MCFREESILSNLTKDRCVKFFYWSKLPETKTSNQSLSFLQLTLKMAAPLRAVVALGRNTFSRILLGKYLYIHNMLCLNIILEIVDIV